MRFTPNDTVTVKLTAYGRKRAIAAMDAFNDHIRITAPDCSYRKSVPFDADGIIKGQFWAVVNDVGGYDGTAGGDVIFDWIEYNG